MNVIDKLIERRILIQKNDFIDMPLQAWIRLVDISTNSVLLEFDTTLEVADTQYRYAIASARLQRDNLDILIKTGVLGCAITWIPDSRYNRMVPFDLSWWRGGAAAIADVVLQIEKVRFD